MTLGTRNANLARGARDKQIEVCVIVVIVHLDNRTERVWLCQYARKNTKGGTERATRRDPKIEFDPKVGTRPSRNFAAVADHIVIACCFTQKVSGSLYTTSPGQRRVQSDPYHYFLCV